MAYCFVNIEGAKMETKKFIWGYLIYNKCVGVPSYWGGIKIPENELTRLNCSYKEVYGKYIEEIEQYGIDWEATKEPQSDRFGTFDGTDNDPDYVECLRGTLILKNGIKQQWSETRVSLESVFSQIQAIMLFVGKSSIFK